MLRKYFPQMKLTITIVNLRLNKKSWTNLRPNLWKNLKVILKTRKKLQTYSLFKNVFKFET